MKMRPRARMQRQFLMFASPPRGLKVIKVSKVCCERQYVAQLESGKVFKVQSGLCTTEFAVRELF